MTLSPAILGALVGAVLGIVGLISLRAVADRVENMKGTNDPKTAAQVLRIAALGDLILFPVVGFFVGPMLFT
ncbi:MAG: hypothetical protein APF80_08630 [Alphaproteobacteria bacterium BRH_c36]|nr:MAG: hypothetical protein APF80_08630 [Alphaproteobacteria bacterium BRH_c36]